MPQGSLTQYKVYLNFPSDQVIIYLFLIEKKIQKLYQHIQILPEVLRHEAKQSEESPPEAVKAGVAIVRVPSSFHTCEALRTSPVRRKKKYTFQLLKIRLTKQRAAVRMKEKGYH